MDRTETITIGDVCEIICKHCVKAHGACRHHWDCPLLTEIAKFTARKDEPQKSCGTCKNKGFEGCEQPCLECGWCGLYEPTTQTETQNSNSEFEKRTMRDCYNCKRYESEEECVECKYEPKQTEPQIDCAWK